MLLLQDCLFFQFLLFFDEGRPLVSILLIGYLALLAIGFLLEQILLSLKLLLLQDLLLFEPLLFVEHLLLSKHHLLLEHRLFLKQFLFFQDHFLFQKLLLFQDLLLLEPLLLFQDHLLLPKFLLLPHGLLFQQLLLGLQPILIRITHFNEHAFRFKSRSQVHPINMHHITLDPGRFWRRNRILLGDLPDRFHLENGLRLPVDIGAQDRLVPILRSADDGLVQLSCCVFRDCQSFGGHLAEHAGVNKLLLLGGVQGSERICRDQPQLFGRHLKGLDVDLLILQTVVRLLGHVTGPRIRFQDLSGHEADALLLDGHPTGHEVRTSAGVDHLARNETRSYISVDYLPRNERRSLLRVQDLAGDEAGTVAAVEDLSGHEALALAGLDHLTREELRS